MTVTSLAFKGPPPTGEDHPALRFFSKYLKDFKEKFYTMSPEDYYNAKCKMYMVDLSVTEGSDKLWRFFGSLYSPFPRVNREFLSLIVVSDDGDGTHQLHIEVVTTLYPGESKPAVPVPQSFVYVLGKADEGKGTDGLQFKELRCYYDYSLIEKARAML